MSSKPKFFLLDAGPIIEVHRLGLWNDVLNRAEIVVPNIVIEREADFWIRDDNSFQTIDVTADIAAGRLSVLDCDADELRKTVELFDPAVQQSIQAGELQALTLMRCWEEPPFPEFCSADRMAIVCLCLLGFSDTAISLEALLGRIGFTVRLVRRFTRKSMDQWVADGRTRRAQALGLA